MTASFGRMPDTDLTKRGGNLGLSLWKIARIEKAHLVPCWQVGGPVDLWPQDESDDLSRFSSALQMAPDEQTRLLCAERLLPKFPLWSGLRALLTYYYSKFEDEVSAQEQITGFYNICARGVDVAFDVSADKYREFWIKSNSELYGPEFHVAFPWSPILHRDTFRRASLPAKASAIFARWTALSASIPPSEIITRYLRYQVIETHEIEGVLTLGDETISCLTRVGFHGNAILSMVPTSTITSKDAVVKSLKDCDLALQHMASVARGDASLDEKLIFDLHELVQRQSRFETLSYDDTASIVVKRTGALRGELCYTTLHSDDSAVVEFAPADALPSLFPNMLADFNDTAGSQGKEWSPLHAAAYMHHVFVSIHPFSDGNGRLGRIIASLPLLRTGAPPILITRALRTRYLDAIQSVRETSDLSALVDVFADGMAEGLEFVESLPELGDDRKI